MCPAATYLLPRGVDPPLQASAPTSAPSEQSTPGLAKLWCGVPDSEGTGPAQECLKRRSGCSPSRAQVWRASQPGDRQRASDLHLASTLRISFSGRSGPVTEVGGVALWGIVLVAGPVALARQGPSWTVRSQQPVWRAGLRLGVASGLGGGKMFLSLAGPGPPCHSHGCLWAGLLLQR